MSVEDKMSGAHKPYLRNTAAKLEVARDVVDGWMASKQVEQADLWERGEREDQKSLTPLCHQPQYALVACQAGSTVCVQELTLPTCHS